MKIRLEYNSRQGTFHFSPVGRISFIAEALGWVAIMDSIPENVAADFIDYAYMNLLNTKKYYTWRMMQKELYKWLENG